MGNRSERDNRWGRARVLVIGVGGLGCPAALALAGSGIGTLVLADPDRVELSNLPRQLLHQEADIGRHKVDSAAETLSARFPDVRIERIDRAIDADNAADVLANVDFAIDATDGTATKLMINDAAVRAGVAFSHAGVVGFSGQLLAVAPGRVPCVRCVFPDLESAAEEAEATCREAGIVGPVAGLFGALQAQQALDYLAGAEVPAQLHTYDGIGDRWRRIDTTSSLPCPLCAGLARGARGEGDQPWAM